MKGILGRKAGMTQVFTADGTLIPVTVVVVSPNVVMQKKTMEKDGYEAVKVGFEDVPEKKANKPMKGIAAKANTAPKKYLHEFKDAEMQKLNVGDQIRADLFKAGDIVDVTGTSRGKGYMGAVYRNNQSTGPNAHGSGFHRSPGSLATVGRNNGYINKNRIMAGHEGVYTTTNQNLEVIKVDAEEGYMLIKGNVPGPRRGLVIVKETVKPVKSVEAKELLVAPRKKSEEPAEEQAPAEEVKPEAAQAAEAAQAPAEEAKPEEKKED